MGQFKTVTLLLALQYLACDAASLQKRGSVNSIPIVSQVKSAIQAAAGDHEGARRTQQDFIETCEIVAPIYAVVEAAQGNDHRAAQILNNYATTRLHAIDGIPVVGHVKGGVHYALGDKEAGDNCMKAVTRTTVQAAGALAGGPAGYVGATLAHDQVTTVAFQEPTGIFECVSEFVDGWTEGDPGKSVDNFCYMALEGRGVAEARKLKGILRHVTSPHQIAGGNGASLPTLHYPRRRKTMWTVRIAKKLNLPATTPPAAEAEAAEAEATEAEADAEADADANAFRPPMVLPRRRRRRNRRENRQEIRCFHCRCMGHTVRDCDRLNKNRKKKAQQYIANEKLRGSLTRLSDAIVNLCPRQNR